MSIFWDFSHFLFKFKSFHEFSFQNVISNLSLHEASVCVCGCVHPLNKDLSQATIGTFFLCLFQKMVGWVAFEVSICFMLKFKPFKMWWPMSLFILLRFLLCVWKVIPYRKGFKCNMRQKQNWNVICFVSFKNQNWELYCLLILECPVRSK